MSHQHETRQISQPIEMIEKSDMQKFFEDQTILVTGATGFLGKLVIEKLLRSCYDLRKIYVLVRNKKGVSYNERFVKIFQAECFEPLKKQHPNFLEKVELVFGDCLLPDVGLKAEDKKKIQEEVTSIFHIAATVRFDQHIKSAAFINVRSVIDLLKMAKEMPQLKVFLHVSTAFSFCPRESILEEFYKPPISADKLLSLVDTLDDATLLEITPTLLKNWPNTYVFTKAVAESVIRRNGIGLPVAMVRPGIVTVSAREPVAGWIDNMYGVTGVVAGAALGALRTMPANPDANAEIVPVDFVINNIIVAAWGVGKEAKPAESEVDIPIYNFVPSPWVKLTWKKFFELTYDFGMDYPTTRAIWYFCFALRPNPIHHEVALFFLHTVPAHFLDLILACIGKEPIAVKGYQKIRKFLDVIAYFAKRNWTFGAANTKKLLKKMSLEDRKMFNFDFYTLDVNETIKAGIMGGRQYLIKDTPDTIPQARRKYKLLKYAHYTLLVILWLILLKVLHMVYRLIL